MDRRSTHLKYRPIIVCRCELYIVPVRDVSFREWDRRDRQVPLCTAAPSAGGVDNTTYFTSQRDSFDGLDTG